MIELEVYKKSDFYKDFISSQKEYYEREQVDKLLAEKDKEIARNKFKRCRANAKWCHDMWFLLRFDKEAKKSIFFWRWWNIWLEIADKFKEAK